MMISRIHVNQHIIKRNKAKAPGKPEKPPLTIKNYKENIKAFEVFIDGPCRIIYRPNNPLDCGAHVWVETESKVTTYRPAFFAMKGD